MDRSATDRSAPTPVRSSQRIEWIDVAKGVGIIWVVIGHSHLPMDDWIYHFHMPLFFMLAGMVFKPDTAERFTAKRVRSLLIPYVAYMLLITFIDNVIAIAEQAKLGIVITNDVRHIPREIYGGRKLSDEYGAMWFITCLFCALLLYNVVRQRLDDICSRRMIAFVAATSIVAYLVSRITLPWNLAEVPVAILFLWLGELWLRVFGPEPTSRLIRSPMTVAALLIAILGFVEFAPIDIKGGELGTPGGSLIEAAAWSHLVLVACRAMADIPWPRAMLSSIGRASLVILFLHLMFANRLHADISNWIKAALGVFVPYLCYLAFKQAGPTTRLFFLGEPLPASAPVLVRQLIAVRRRAPPNDPKRRR